MRKPKAQHESATRERIVQAAIETLSEEGFAGTTARAIAAHGGFNQALIFYHFGSVPALLVEAFRETSEEQIAKYQAAATEVGSLVDLVEIARRLHAEDLETGSITAVTQLMAAAASDSEVGRVILDRFEKWIQVVEDALKRGIEGQPLEPVVPVREAAYAISAMFLGIELMSRLDPARSEAERVFDMMATLAGLIEQFMPMLVGLQS
jgi:AcrR family transcriptional regulator